MLVETKKTAKNTSSLKVNYKVIRIENISKPFTADNRCIAACPECLRQCKLTQGHYSDHKDSEGHTWL